MIVVVADIGGAFYTNYFNPKLERDRMIFWLVFSVSWFFFSQTSSELFSKGQRNDL